MTATLAVATKRIRVPAQVKLEGDEEGQVSAVFSTFDRIDHDGDIIAAGAIPEIDIAMVWSHQWSGFPIGRGTIQNDPDRAVFTGRFFMETWHGDEAYKTVKAMGELQEWSWAFRITDAYWEEREGQMVRVITQTEPDEVSPVLRGAGMGTHTLDVKSLDAGDVDAWVTEIIPAKELAEISNRVMAGEASAMTELASRIYQAGRKAAGRTLAEDGAFALAAATQFASRLASLVELRGRDGRRPSKDRVEQAEQLTAQLVGLRAQLDDTIAQLDDITEPESASTPAAPVEPAPPGDGNDDGKDDGGDAAGDVEARAARAREIYERMLLDDPGDD